MHAFTLLLPLTFLEQEWPAWGELFDGETIVASRADGASMVEFFRDPF